MVFGHNTNIKIGTTTFHVQTEDRGESHALIDTTVYFNGRVLHRRTNSYLDLLPLNEDRQQALKLRLDEQHRALLEELQSGALQLAMPRAAEVPPEPPPLRKFVIDLINAKSWLSGKRATLQMAVLEENGEPVPDVKVEATIDGSAEPHVFGGHSNALGHAQIEFDMPRITHAEAALVIRAESAEGQGHLRFALRAKPRVPSAQG